MPKVSQLISVEVQDQGVDAGRRRLELCVSAQSDLFSLSDMLVREGAIKELDVILKSTARRAVAEYIGSGKGCLKEMANRKRREAEKTKM